MYIINTSAISSKAAQQQQQQNVLTRHIIYNDNIFNYTQVFEKIK